MKNLFIIMIMVSFVFGYGQSQSYHQTYRDIRKTFRQKMPKNSVAILFAAPIKNRANDVNYIYHQDPNFSI